MPSTYIAPWADLSDEDHQALQRAMNASPNVLPIEPLAVTIDVEAEDADMATMLRTARWRAETWTASLRRLRAERGVLGDEYAGYAAQLENWRDATMTPIERGVAFLEQSLKNFGRMIRTLSQDNIKTIPLPGGRISTVKREPTVEVVDEAAFVAWVKASPAQEVSDTVEYRPHVMMAKVKLIAFVKDGKVITAAGEVIPGLGATAGSINATVVTA